MPKQGTYFISRLIKVGELTLEEIISSLARPKVVTSRTSSYTITDFSEQYLHPDKYYYGKLTKFKSEGQVKIIDRESNTEKFLIEPDLIIASSPFLFLPDYSCFVYLRVWNQIDMVTFSNRMREIILASKDFYFVDCELQPVSDIKSFLERVRRITIINQIRAKVNPPNPLFGHLWKSLEIYLSKRNIDELKISEKATNKPLQTDLIGLLQQISENDNLESIDPNEVKIGDAAILMSMDGYGSGTIEGQINQRFVTIRTNQKSVQFHFPIDGNIDELYQEAKKILDSINNQRYMSHND